MVDGPGRVETVVHAVHGRAAELEWTGLGGYRCSVQYVVDGLSSFGSSIHVLGCAG